jgi:hypothetical protein
VRNCEYRSPTECTVRHYERTFDLSKLRSVDLFLSYWGPKWMAHTMLSFGFESGDQVCISIETRKEVGEDYSAIGGFFKQYELIYVVGDERDLVRQRTNVRREEVYLYRLKSAPEARRAVFLDYLRMVNELTVRPEWYNSLANNCTSTIRGHTVPYAPDSRWNWKVLLNGFADRLAYQNGVIQDGDLPFEEIKARCRINDRAAAAADDPEFSKRIREGLPGSAR